MKARSILAQGVVCWGLIAPIACALAVLFSEAVATAVLFGVKAVLLAVGQS